VPLTVAIGVARPLTGCIAHQGADDYKGGAVPIERANARELVSGGRPVTLEVDLVDAEV
jgi:hypothetical protein